MIASWELRLRLSHFAYGEYTGLILINHLTRWNGTQAVANFLNPGGNGALTS